MGAPWGRRGGAAGAVGVLWGCCGGAVGALGGRCGGAVGARGSEGMRGLEHGV